MENFQQLEILETGSLMCLECLGLPNALETVPMMENFQQLEILETALKKSRSISEELASFVNLKNIRTLLMVTEAFWHLCQPVNDEELWKTKRRLTYPAIYSLIDATKDRHRFCALQFE
ncbi:uncharacterized protein B0P05DRAFT_590169 [Gilbertella persicaria]|uniref:uncharacterized protein n=1 Tax=Gilbertella persicaria TaxID=101096 RepID=UPI00221F7ACF|nr:uncharacterized protein B0P05DRAFT_590169 [Gilbertella persicaria]KAI8064343.1 hypothetical protein B0P05DRAFT_590169 [Gilbertella persicaria]